MKRLGIAFAAATALTILPPSQPAHAGNGAVAAGIVGGLAAGAIIGSAVAAPPPYYYYPPAPIVVAEPPPPVAVAPGVGGCYWTRGAPVWDGWRGAWVRPQVQVCD